MVQKYSITITRELVRNADSQSPRPSESDSVAGSSGMSWVDERLRSMGWSVMEWLRSSHCYIPESLSWRCKSPEDKHPDRRERRERCSEPHQTHRQGKGCPCTETLDKFRQWWQLPLIKCLLYARHGATTHISSYNPPFNAQVNISVTTTATLQRRKGRLRAVDPQLQRASASPGGFLKSHLWDSSSMFLTRWV